MKAKIQEISAEVCEDPYDLVCYAYEVRKQDGEQMNGAKKRPENYYTNLLLGDVKMDELLRIIIESNHWINDRMKVVPENLHYELRIGDEYKYELRCGSAK